jgi:hypothetical protein
MVDVTEQPTSAMSLSDRIISKVNSVPSNLPSGNSAIKALALTGWAINKIAKSYGNQRPGSKLGAFSRSVAPDAIELLTEGFLFATSIGGM